jgi:hypothetical protein
VTFIIIICFSDSAADFLDFEGYDGIGDLQRQIDGNIAKLKDLEDRGKGSSTNAVGVRTTLANKSSTKAKYDELVEAEAREAQEKENPPSPLPDKSSIPHYIDIIHDTEECLCDGDLRADKLLDLTLWEILSAVVGKSPEELQKSSLKLNTDVVWTWSLCYRSSDKYPQEKRLRDMSAIRVSCRPCPKKRDSVGTKVKQLLTISRVQYNARRDEAQQKSTVVLIARGRDNIYNNEVKQLLKKGIKVILLCNESNTGEMLKSLVDPTSLLQKWETLVQKARPEARRPLDLSLMKT